MRKAQKKALKKKKTPRPARKAPRSVPRATKSPASRPRPSKPVRPLKVADSLDGRVRALATRVSQTIQLAMDKALAHLEDPRTFPLPRDGDSLERKLVGRFQSLPNKLRKRASKQALQAINAPAAQRRGTYGVLADIDVRSASPIAEQSAARPLPARLRITEDYLKNHRLLPRLKQLQQRPSPRGGKPPSKLLVELQTVECVNDTKELGKDEIFLAGIIEEITVEDGKLNVAKRIVQPVDLGKFRKGDEVDLDQLTFTAINFNDFPKFVNTRFFLIEKDLGGAKRELREILNNAVDAEIIVYGIVGVLLLAAIALIAAGGPVAVVIAGIVTIIASLVALGVRLYERFFKDDFFVEQAAALALVSEDFRFEDDETESAPETLPFAIDETNKKKGLYNLSFNFRLV